MKQTFKAPRPPQGHRNKLATKYDMALCLPPAITFNPGEGYELNRYRNEASRGNLKVK